MNQRIFELEDFILNHSIVYNSFVYLWSLAVIFFVVNYIMRHNLSWVLGTNKLRMTMWWSQVHLIA